MRFQFSWILVPLVLILSIFLKQTRQYLIPLALCISIIGITEILFYDKNLTLFNKIIQIISHLVVLFCLIDFLNVNLNNIVNYILLILSIIFIIFVPYWPYYMPRYTLLLSFIIIYLITIMTNVISKI